ncbi:MAG: type II CRISPR RNA-guided endonuclease Cas9, partial [Candidatus Acidiferrales bacterium]
AILERVKHLKGERAITSAKLRRFEMDDEKLEGFLADFRERQLNDTAYASSLAASYLGLLYGGVVDADGRRRVQATSGRATYDFRALWQLNEVFSDGPTTNGGRAEKKRTDHRHHAIDALVIGLTDAGMIKRLADAAQRAPSEHRRRFASLEAPWHNFVDSVRAEVDKIVVSHRVSKKVSGALHEETIYSAPKADGKVRVRKPLRALTKNEVEDIADPRVKALVVAKLNDGDPKKVFANGETMPFFEASDGRRIPIKRVRVNKVVPTFTLSKGNSARRVTSESNHHIEIFAEVDERDNEVEWDGCVVSLAESYRRAEARLPIVRQDFGPRRRFKFSLAPSEVIECVDKSGGRGLFVVRKMSHLTSGQIQIGMAPLADARKAKEMQASRTWLWVNPNTLRERNPRKVVVSPLGEVSEAHD